jgi:hypothetical protein
MCFRPQVSRGEFGKRGRMGDCVKSDWYILMKIDVLAELGCYVIYVAKHVSVMTCFALAVIASSILLGQRREREKEWECESGL